MIEKLRSPVVPNLDIAGRKVDDGPPAKARGVREETQSQMLLQTIRNGLCEGVHEGPEGDLVQDILRKRRRFVSQRRLETTTTNGEERRGREEETQMIAFAHEALNVFQVGLLSGEKTFPQTGELATCSVGQKEGRVTAVDAKPEVDHALRGDDSALCGRNEVTQMNGCVKERVHGASGLPER